MIDPKLLELSAKGEAKLEGARAEWNLDHWWIIRLPGGGTSSRALNPYDGNDMWKIVELMSGRIPDTMQRIVTEMTPDRGAVETARAAWFKLCEEIVK